MSKPTVFILAVSSDIGFSLAKQYLNDGYRVIGTYRRQHAFLKEIEKHDDCTLLRCDVAKNSSARRLFEKFHDAMALT